MTVSVTLVSQNEEVLRLVHDFARGLGCAADMSITSGGPSLRIEVEDSDRSLLELLTHVALSATKVGVDVAEPLCQLTYQHRGVTSQVTLALRLADVRIETTPRPAI
jgi:hypothetical protein